MRKPRPSLWALSARPGRLKIHTRGYFGLSVRGLGFGFWAQIFVNFSCHNRETLFVFTLDPYDGNLNPLARTQLVRFPNPLKKISDPM